MPFLNINNKNLYFESVGQGTPLVLIHSALMDSRMWETQVKELSAQYQVITYDLYGYGQSAFTDAKQVDHIEDLRGLLDALGISKAHILGASMGSEIAMRFALEYPAYTRSLVLVGPELEGYDYPEASMRWWDGFIGAIRDSDFEQARSIFIHNALDSSAAPLSAAIRERIEQIMKGYTFRHYVDNTLLWKDYEKPALEQLSEVLCPVLMVMGSADRPTNYAIAQVLMERLAKPSQVVIEAANHLPNLQQPEAFNRALVAFLESAEPTA